MIRTTSMNIHVIHIHIHIYIYIYIYTHININIQKIISKKYVDTYDAPPALNL